MASVNARRTRAEPKEGRKSASHMKIEFNKEMELLKKSQLETMMLTQLSKLKAQWKTLPIEWTIKKTDPELEDKVKGLDHSGKVNNTLKNIYKQNTGGIWAPR